MKDNYQLMKDILNKYKKGDYYDYEHKSNGWYEYEKIIQDREPTMMDLINMMEKLIEKHPRNIIKILESLPEEEIQKFLRAKKMAKIKSK